MILGRMMCLKSLDPYRAIDPKIKEPVLHHFLPSFLSLYLSRIRELEAMIIDFKASVERRINKLFEEGPSKYQSQFKQFEDREQQLFKETHSKQLLIHEGQQQIKESVRRVQEQNNQQILSMQ